MARQFVTWHAAQTPHGPYSWAVVDGLLHVRLALGTKFADIGGPDPELENSIGTKRTCRDRTGMSAYRAKPENICSG
jgi:hypothetical protein